MCTDVEEMCFLVIHRRYGRNTDAIWYQIIIPRGGMVNCHIFFTPSWPSVNFFLSWFSCLVWFFKMTKGGCVVVSGDLRTIRGWDYRCKGSVHCTFCLAVGPGSQVPWVYLSVELDENMNVSQILLSQEYKDLQGEFLTKGMFTYIFIFHYAIYLHLFHIVFNFFLVTSMPKLKLKLLTFWILKDALIFILFCCF